MIREKRIDKDATPVLFQRKAITFAFLDPAQRKNFFSAELNLSKDELADFWHTP
jgi:hypothetical protein